MLCYDHNFCKLQTLPSLECILRKFHVNCHNATVNILITIVRIFLVSKVHTQFSFATAHRLHHWTTLYIPGAFLGRLCCKLCLRDGWRDTSDSRGESSLQVPWVISPVTGFSLSVRPGLQYTFLLNLSLLSQLWSVSTAIVILCTLTGLKRNGARKQRHLLARIPRIFSEILLPRDIR